MEKYRVAAEKEPIRVFTGPDCLVFYVRGHPSCIRVTDKGNYLLDSSTGETLYQLSGSELTNLLSPASKEVYTKFIECIL